MAFWNKYFILCIILCSVFVLKCSSQYHTGPTDETGCPPSFQKRCRCGRMTSRFSPNQLKYIVNCTNSGFTNTTMLWDVPENTNELIFTGNNIPELPTNILDNQKFYEDLEVLDLSNNHIRHIRGKTFHKVYTVSTLILNHNDIEITDENEKPRIFSNFEELVNLHLTNAFTERIQSSYYLISLENVFFESDLRLLKKLHLEQNEIYSIGTNKSLFCQLTNLEDLYLGDNRLSDIDFRVDCMRRLRYIDVQRNSINKLSREAIERLRGKNGLTVEMQNNPFTCDCLSKYFIDWVQNPSVTLRDLPAYTCMDGFPYSNIGKELIEVTELGCPVEGYSASVIGALSFFLVFLSSLLLTVAYFQRNKIKKFVIPYWTFVTRKIGYTGIANEEAPQEVNV